MARKLYAIVHDGTFDGDSLYYCPNCQVPYTKGMTIDNIRQAYLKQIEEAEKGNPFTYSHDEWVNETNKIRGAWILDSRGLAACEAVWDSEPGNDSATYNCNTSAKHVADSMCIRIIGCKPNSTRTDL